MEVKDKKINLQTEGKVMILLIDKFVDLQRSTLGMSQRDESGNVQLWTNELVEKPASAVLRNGFIFCINFSLNLAL